MVYGKRFTSSAHVTQACCPCATVLYHAVNKLIILISFFIFWLENENKQNSPLRRFRVHFSFPFFLGKKIKEARPPGHDNKLATRGGSHFISIRIDKSSAQ